jgi:hypothetical protein
MPARLNERSFEIRWSDGSCGDAGCASPSCVCALCARPIGVSADDPRWWVHREECLGCELCEDQVPIMLWRNVGNGKTLQQAAFHGRCFKKLLE